ncbi:MAG: hypothetical protein QMD36_06185 [Candidatus Aenigmarchaeota archaeon]|nr:hypothetical protein [Candidatus Aenigmarchaeota archaeon]
MKEEFTYANAGVDISRVKKAHKSIANLCSDFPFLQKAISEDKNE